MPDEGVIKFDLRYTYAEPENPRPPSALNAWRNRLWQLQLIGQQAGRYGGAGYGNVSRRIEVPYTHAGHPRFIISGTQTGALARLDARHYCVVTDWDIQCNRVIARGPVRPSSEALTHGMLYNQNNDINVVFHVHSPAIWRTAHRLGLTCSDPDVAYGTPEMAAEVARLFTNTDVGQSSILVMGGHEDGVIAFGFDEESAGAVLLNALERSKQM
ncbi:MAG: class II aldolase/adducin family protein [Gammaproteobacteria bacterium]